MKQIAIYDLDRTITRYATFTPFLIFAAKRRPARLLLLPIFFVALLGYPLRLLDRKALKQLGFRLVLGRQVSEDKLRVLAQSYAAHVVQNNVYAKALAQIAADKAKGCQLVMATASPDFYAQEIGALLGFDHVIGTVQARTSDGGYVYRIASENCYSTAKLKRIEDWMTVPRDAADVSFYSDHHSDQPVLEWANQAVATNPNAKLRALAQARGWQIVSYA